MSKQILRFSGFVVRFSPDCILSAFAETVPALGMVDACIGTVNAHNEKRYNTHCRTLSQRDSPTEPFRPSDKVETKEQLLKLIIKDSLC